MPASERHPREPAAVALLCAAACAGYATSRGALGARAAREATGTGLVSATEAGSNSSHGKHRKSGAHGGKADRHGAEADESFKEQYCLAVMDFKGEEKNQLSVKMGEMIKQLGDDDDDSGWVWAEKVADGEDDKAETGYVPTFAIQMIPAGSSKDAVKPNAKQEKKHGKHDD